MKKVCPANNVKGKNETQLEKKDKNKGDIIKQSYKKKKMKDIKKIIIRMKAIKKD